MSVHADIIADETNKRLPFERKENKFKFYAFLLPKNSFQVNFWAWYADFQQLNSKNAPVRMDRGKGKVINVLVHMTCTKM